MTAIKNGDKVKVHYTGSLDNGTVFDSSEAREPMEFTVGSGQLIKGFDQGVLGMKKGEEKTVHIAAADAYGEHNDKLIRRIPRTALPQDREPQVGMVIGLVRSDGMQGEARITELTKEDIAIDMNHPLAGKDLNFKIKIVEVN